MKRKLLFPILIFALILIVFAVVVNQREGGIPGFFGIEIEPPYDPQINPEEFQAVVANRFFSIKPGEKLLYSGAVRRELTLPGDKKTIIDVETVILYEKVYRGTELVKDAQHYLAQDAQKNVWCFGQDIKNIRGTTSDSIGSWMTGVDGAKPGIWMKDKPQIGENFPQEYYEDGAEDIAEILSTSETVDASLGKFFGCIKVRDWSPLTPSQSTIKYYCPGIAKVVREEGPSGTGTTNLVEVTTIEEPEVVPSSEPDDEELSEVEEE